MMLYMIDSVGVITHLKLEPSKHRDISRDSVFCVTSSSDSTES